MWSGVRGYHELWVKCCEVGGLLVWIFGYPHTSWWRNLFGLRELIWKPLCDKIYNLWYGGCIATSIKVYHGFDGRVLSKIWLPQKREALTLSRKGQNGSPRTSSDSLWDGKISPPSLHPTKPCQTSFFFPLSPVPHGPSFKRCSVLQCSYFATNVECGNQLTNCRRDGH